VFVILGVCVCMCDCVVFDCFLVMLVLQNFMRNKLNIYLVMRYFIAKISLNLLVKEFLKSVNIWHR